MNKSCAVPECESTSQKTPNKLFIYVPHKKNIRHKWLNLARRDPSVISLNSTIYFCEDHFDLPNDMENYIRYLVMGSVSHVRIKPGCLPKRFECQLDRRKRTSNNIKRMYILKKQRKMLVEESLRDFKERSTNYLDNEGTSSESSVLHTIEEKVKEENLQEVPKTANKSIQVYIAHKFRSKAVQTPIKLVNQTTSPVKYTPSQIHQESSS